AAQAFVAGQYDAALTYEPYLSQVRNAPNAGKIILTTLDYPCVVDMVAFQPDFIKKNPKIVQGVVNGFFDALEMIKREPDKSYEIMGSKVKQSGADFAKSASYIAWQDKAANQAYFKGELQAFMKEAAEIQLEAGVIKKIPDLRTMVYDSFSKQSPCSNLCNPCPRDGVPSWGFCFSCCSLPSGVASPWAASCRRCSSPIRSRRCSPASRCSPSTASSSMSGSPSGAWSAASLSPRSSPCRSAS